jgi:hypothetical protein
MSCRRAAGIVTAKEQAGALSPALLLFAGFSRHPPLAKAIMPAKAAFRKM